MLKFPKYGILILLIVIYLLKNASGGFQSFEKYIFAGLKYFMKY